MKGCIERQTKICDEIWSSCRDELTLRYPKISAALCGVEYEVNETILCVGTDGNRIVYNPGFVCSRYLKNRLFVNRGYLHMIIHCLFLHPVCESSVDVRLWNIACDIFVEYVIDQNFQREKVQPFSNVRETMYRKVKELDGLINAQLLYTWLMDHENQESDLLALESEFYLDDHSVWSREDLLKHTQCTKEKWERITANTSQNNKGSTRRAGSMAGSKSDEFALRERRRYDYRRFLKRFAVTREEIQLDTDSFDYILYTYGFNHYNNMPLVEHLEYKEMTKLEQIVIAIDTSGSCSKELVQRFLEETYAMFLQQENFFKKMKVYILQCDCYIQDAVCLTCEEEWYDYMNHIKIQGRGGTDFRPVFRYIEELKKKKEIRNMKGLLYFTDGDGIFPRDRPDYETAFIFIEEACLHEEVPVWAVKLVLPVS